MGQLRIRSTVFVDSPAGAPRPVSAVCAAPASWRLGDDEPAYEGRAGAFSLIDIGEDPVPASGRDGLLLCVEVLDTSAPVQLKARFDARPIRTPGRLAPGTKSRFALVPRRSALTEVTLVLGALGSWACHCSVEDRSGVVLHRRRVAGGADQIEPRCFFVLG